MEQAASQEIQPVQLKATQREKILKEHINTDSKKELFGILAPHDKPVSKTTINKEFLKHFAESLGKKTHIVLFGLAATSRNPTELQNILSNIADLKKVSSLYWNLEESENKFLTRPLPEYLNASEETENEVESVLGNRDITMDEPQYSQHLLELLFYVYSAKNVPLEYKRNVLEFFYNTEALTSSPFRDEDRQAVYGSDSSFWNHVDGSWIDPKLAPASSPKGHVEQPKKPNIVRSVVSDVEGRLERFGEEITQAPKITTVEALLKKSKEEIARLKEEARAKEEAKAKAATIETETTDQRESRIRGILRGVNEFLAQPSDEAARLRAADQQASHDLAQSLGSLARKMPDLFRRTPQEEIQTDQQHRK